MGENDLETVASPSPIPVMDENDLEPVIDIVDELSSTWKHIFKYGIEHMCDYLSEFVSCKGARCRPLGKRKGSFLHSCMEMRRCGSRVVIFPTSSHT